MATTRRFVFLFCTLFLVINFHIADVAAVCWTSINDVHGFGGTSHKLSSYRDCQSTCVRTVACVAVDWQKDHPQGDTCWILTSIGIAPTTEKGIITHYVLDRHCTTKLPTPATSTTRSSLTDGISGASPAPAGNETRYVGLTDTKDALAIRPAYVVIAGLGAGNLLMVIVAIIVICSYPLNRTDSYKNGAGGGDGGVENYQMGNAHHGYDDGYVDAEQQPPPPPQQQQQQWGGTGYVDENDANDKRYTSSSYDDQPPTVEENPYFNKDEIEASAAF